MSKKKVKQPIPGDDFVPDNLFDIVDQILIKHEKDQTINANNQNKDDKEQSSNNSNSNTNQL